jgi:hypothetical protein
MANMWLSLVPGKSLNASFDEALYFGVDKISARLNEDGIAPFESLNDSELRTKQLDGKAIWYDSHIHRIVTGRLVRGEWALDETVYEKRTLIVRGESIDYEVPVRHLTGAWKKHYPEVISEEVRQAANAAIEARRSGRGRKGAGFPNIFQGIGKCAKCGGAMIYENTIKRAGSKKSYERLTCINRRRRPCDSNFNYDYVQVEREFLTIFQDDVLSFLDNVPENNAALPLKLRIADLRQDLIYM